jgi:BlaR1 peptidase M56
VGFMHLRRIRESSKLVDLRSLDPTVQDALKESFVARTATICVSESLRVPAAIGFFKPVVVLPAWALTEMPASELRPLLLHELAHLKRWDDWTNLVQQIFQAVLFFHPAVWWIGSRLSLEREMACDEIVLAHTKNPRAYAQSLLSVAEKSFLQRGLSLAQAAVNRMRHTSFRVSRILSTDRPHTTRLCKPAVVLLAGCGIFTLVGIPRVPQLVGFVDGSPVPETVAPNFQSMPSPTPKTFQLATLAIQPANRKLRMPTLARMMTVRNEGRIQASRTVKTPSAVWLSQTEARLSNARLPDRQINNALIKKASTGASPVYARQALFVIVQSSTDRALRSGYWTIQVWQLTVYRSSTSESQIPAKKV